MLKPHADTLEEQCVKKGMRMTEQRRVVARVIEASDDHPDVEELYRRATIYALPSVAEPFGLTVLEATRAGVPSIVSRQAGVTEVLSSLVPVDPGDAAGLAVRMLFLLNAPVYRWLLARGAADELRTLSWSRAAARCLAVYAEVC